MLGEITFRVATEADGSVLADLERRSPLVLGDDSLVIDRGDDYFAAARLMEDVTIVIAEVDGVPVGAFCGAVHRAMVGGVERRLLYFHHTRIPPEYQRQGVGRKLAVAVREAVKDRQIDSDYWYISPQNAKSQAFAKDAANHWRVQPVWATLDCAAIAGPAHGRAATPADATEVVAILNACHQGEEMFLPYTVASLTARLERAPAQYSWERLWLGNGAVVGVWPEGESISVRLLRADGAVEVSRGGAVLDYGCLAGAELELELLLRAWAGWLAPRGMAELSLFTCPGTRTWALVAPLAVRLDPFDFWTPFIPEPEDAAQHGLYVDHVYF